jgi:hypothetical protein
MLEERWDVEDRAILSAESVPRDDENGRESQKWFLKSEVLTEYLWFTVNRLDNVCVIYSDDGIVMSIRNVGIFLPD